MASHIFPPHTTQTLLSTHPLKSKSYPTTNGGMQNGSSVKTCTNCTHVFARLAPICMLGWCLFTKFLHWTSVGSLLRVRCWLGITPLLPRNSNPCPCVTLHFLLASSPNLLLPLSYPPLLPSTCLLPPPSFSRPNFPDFDTGGRRIEKGREGRV